MKNKKLIALLLIAALVLGGTAGVMASNPPPPPLPFPFSEIAFLLDCLDYHAVDAGNYCECCFYNQMPDDEDVDAFRGNGFIISDGMTLGDCIDMLMEEVLFLVDYYPVTAKDFLIHSSLFFEDEEEVVEYFGTSDLDKIDNLALATFILTDNNEGNNPFADCGAGCETCAAGECDCCGCGSILDVFEFIRLLAAKLFAIFNYMNTREVVTFD